MHTLPHLISDLALILIVAGAVTLLFKRLHQPLVLGYIVAGFLAGPHFSLVPTVRDISSIETWSNIGVIFLMFTLGLEFSMKKIVKMGLRPILAACLVMGSMIGVGNAVGWSFGWSSTDCLFLGGMLAMSSTTIIYKAFDELGLRQRKFAGEVLSVLILEDILGILLMVILSATAASQQFQGAALVTSLLSLGFFLVLWFVVGIYLIPWMLKKTRPLMNGETLLIVAIGLCFLLVVLADKAGYSAAFGAFMMGSILAETVEAESIERVVAPVKDLFGAIFFVSVGMLVDPKVLIEYGPAIAAITIAILLGQSVLGSGAFLVAGHPLRVAMRCGFSLAQIGEFAFIIAALGVSLGVTSSFLYPVVVAVSIITTFLTPYMIKAAEPTYALLERGLPQSVRRLVRKREDNLRSEENRDLEQSLTPLTAWMRYLRAVIVQTGVFLVLSIATIAIAFSSILPISRQLLTHWPGNILTGVLTLMLLGLFLRPIVMRKNHTAMAKFIARKRQGRLLLWLLGGVRFAIATAVVVYVLEFLSPFRWYYHILAAMVVVLLFIRLRRVKYYSIRMERKFIHNLRQREVAERRRNSDTAYVGRLAARDVHFARLVVPTCSRWGGRSLMELDFTQRDGILVAAILRQEQRINTPAGYNRIYPGDVLEVIADDQSLEAFTQRMQREVNVLPSADGADHTLRLRRFRIPSACNLVGLSVAESGIRDRFHCMLVGFEDEDGNIAIATARQVIERHATLWLVGEEQHLHSFAKYLV